MAGNKKARVLPEPVADIPTVFRPFNAIGQPCDWIGVGFSKPHLISSLKTYSGIEASSKVNTGFGMSVPLTTICLDALHASASCSLRLVCSQKVFDCYFCFWECSNNKVTSSTVTYHIGMFEVKILLERDKLSLREIDVTQRCSKVPSRPVAPAILSAIATTTPVRAATVATTPVTVDQGKGIQLDENQSNMSCNDTEVTKFEDDLVIAAPT